MKNRLFIRHFLTLALIISVQSGASLFAQEVDYHAFNDKKGQAIEAALLSVSQDMKTAKIRRKDKREFDLPIVNLSLDDQQYIKDWLKENPIKKDYNLDVSFVKHQEDSIRVDVPNYDLRWVTDPINYEIIIKNRSRADLIGASIEYFIIVEQGVRANVMDQEAQRDYGIKEWWYSNGPSIDSSPSKKIKKMKQDKPLWLISGKAKIKDLPTNYTMEVTSETFPLREISQSEGRNPKDVIVGVISRVVDKDGNEISVHRSTENNDIMKQSWADISLMPPGNRSGSRQPMSDN